MDLGLLTYHIPNGCNTFDLAKECRRHVVKLVCSILLLSTCSGFRRVSGIRCLFHIVRDHRLPILLVLLCCLLRCWVLCMVVVEVLHRPFV